MNDLITNLNALAPGALRYLLVMEAQIAVFAVVVMAMERTMRVAPRFLYFAWMVVLVKSLVPPFLALPRAAEAWVTAAIPTIAVLAEGPGAKGEVAFSLASIMLVAWGVAVGSMLAIVLFKSLKLRTGLRHSVRVGEMPFPPIRAGRIKDPSIWRCSRISAPLALGILRPRIYVTADFDAQRNAADRTILQHELAHVIRRDAWVVVVQTVSQVLHPFNPLVWVMNMRLSHHREVLCDQFALTAASGDAREYARKLLTFAAGYPRPVPVLGLGNYFFESRAGLKNRLTMLLTQNEERTMNRMTTRQLLAVIMMLLAILPASWRCSGEKNAQTTPVAPAGTAASETPALGATPTPVGGIPAIQQHLRYPEIARKAGIEGKVVLEVEVLSTGEVGEVRVVESLGKNGCDESATAAVKAVRWSPSVVDGQPVDAKVTVPVIFRLK